MKTYSQNKQVLYNFAELPQTLLLNPGAETNYKFHVGVPMLSGFSSEVGITGFTISDLFRVDNRSINDKVSEVLEKLTIRDHIKLNFQIEVLNGGFRYDDKNYFSFGFYEEFDAISYFAKDPITLLTDGNSAYLNKSFDLSQILYKVDVLGVLHFGVTREVSDKLTLGARFKIYSSALNLETSNNTGTFTTVNGSDNIYRHYLDNVNINLKTSGLVEGDEYMDDPNTYLGNTFLGSNLGIGFDAGFTYHLSEQLELTGSIVDFGFIKHKKNIKNSVVNGSYVFDGIEFGYNPTNPINYWDDLDADFKEKVPSGDNQDSYISWRPTKLNASLKYSFGQKRSKYCYDNTYKDFYRNAFGVQLYSVFRPLNSQLALTGFFEKSFSEKLHAKVTYTVDDYSFYNIGVGISSQIGKVNFYGMVDNIAQFNDIASANNISVQLGINIIFN
ncbi:DUF5723 family protein [Polaribacter sp. Hel1_85]|uniref:DUF5723 family protein n=1 Tax=Polaribacter sp. Hel1_85 TaxID=1250005 RepID=UPI001F397EC0|nr:DUF5723 family protein [Polaribacter sp. Hel1_85]